MNLYLQEEADKSGARKKTTFEKKSAEKNETEKPLVKRINDKKTAVSKRKAPRTPSPTQGRKRPTETENVRQNDLTLKKNSITMSVKQTNSFFVFVNRKFQKLFLSF